jgi:hypothetical protein
MDSQVWVLERVGDGDGITTDFLYFLPTFPNLTLISPRINPKTPLNPNRVEVATARPSSSSNSSRKEFNP